MLVARSSHQTRILAATALALSLVGYGARALTAFGHFSPIVWGLGLLALAGVALGLVVRLRYDTAPAERRLTTAAIVIGVLALLFPVELGLALLAIVAMIMVVRWGAGGSGWRWWATTTAAAILALFAGTIVATLALIIAGTGDPRWNLPRWTGISVALLDYLTVLATVLIAGALTGLIVTRRFLAAALVMLGTGAVVSLAWLVVILPGHTNDIRWQMSGQQMLIIAGATIVTSILMSRLLRRHGNVRHPGATGLS
jgi:hypothetical protein